MAYGYNKAGQKSGDIIAATDPQSNTKIAFTNDKIEFITSGSVIASVTSTEFSASSFTVNQLTALTTISASNYIGIPAQFPSSSDGLPYYDSSSIPSVLPPPSTNRNSYVLGWLNNQLTWVVVSTAVSFTPATFAETVTEIQELNYTETIYIQSGTVS